MAEDVRISRERLAELESRSRRVEDLERQVRALEAEVSRLNAGATGARDRRPGSGAATSPREGGVPGWLPSGVKKSVEGAGRAPEMTSRMVEGSAVPMAHVLEHFAADAKAAVERYKGVKVRFTGVVADVDKPLFMAPYDLFFRRAETSLRVRVRLMPPPTATRVYVSQDRMTVVGEGGGRREELARVGASVEFEGMVKGVEGGTVEVRALGPVKGGGE